MLRKLSPALILFMLLSNTPSAHATSAEKKLSPRFRHWITEETAYIIESDERRQFLTLTTDAERDAFIQHFWESRNPDPGSGTNIFQEEHDRRLAYANEHFGDPRYEDGWRTDQGQVYITLGAPKSQVTYPSRQNIRPLVVWFYQSPSPALPPYFYVVFYKRSAGDPYTLYSPYQDGPNRLVTGLEGLNDQRRNLDILRKSMGDEVARLAVSLIPSEPVNLSEFSPSMVSDSMLSTIRGLADNYLEKRAVANRRHLEKVTASIYLAGNEPSVNYTVSHNAAGHTVVQYLIRLKEPDPTLIETRKGGLLGYDLTLRSHITTASGKPVYDDVDVLSGHLQAGQAKAGREKMFSAEERFPLAPGTYTIDSTLTNNLNLQARKFSKSVVVPARDATHLGISNPVIYRGNPIRDIGDHLPFSFSDLRFNPAAVDSVTIHSGDALPCVFQLWLPRDQGGSHLSAPVEMHYTFAPASLVGRPIQDSSETVETSNADKAGDLVTGHVFETSFLAPGVYRLIIRATQAGVAPAARTVMVHVVPSGITAGSWSAYAPPEPAQDASKWELSAKAQGIQHPLSSLGNKTGGASVKEP